MDVIVNTCHCLARAWPGSEDCRGDGDVSAVSMLKRLCVCVSLLDQVRRRWLKSIFVLDSYFRWKWNTWWGKIVITNLQGEWQTIAAVKFSHISAALYSWLLSTLWPSLSLFFHILSTQSLSTSLVLPFLPGIFVVFFPLCLNSLIRWVWERTSPDNTLLSLLYPA